MGAVAIARSAAAALAHVAAAAIAAAAALAAAPAPAGATSAARVIAALNAQRAANGIPAGITENTTWSRDCAAHDAYMARNHTLTHEEVAGKPGYSSGGAFAGRNAVLIEGINWDAGNPYESAPLHLDELLAPRLAVTGSADLDGFSCTITFPGWTRADPAAPTIYTYPGNGGRIYPSEVANEAPFTPGELAGLPQPARTGPNLIVFVEAPGQTPFRNPATLSGATLTGPSGPVALRTVDGNTALPSGSLPTLAPYISPGGFIIPAAPLAPYTTYTAHVVVTFAGVATTHDWSFTTNGADPQSTLASQGESLSFSSSSSATIRVTLTRANGAHVPSVTLRTRQSVRLRLHPGSWEACGHQRAAGTYAGYDRCLSIVVTGQPSLRFGDPAAHGQRVRFPLRFSTVLRGHRAKLTITTVTVKCARHVCTTKPVSRVMRTITLRSGSITIRLPATGRGVRLALTTNSFQIGDAPWDAGHAVSETFLRR
jgi:hypothetical protein